MPLQHIILKKQLPMRIEKAKKEQSRDIARLIMQAMSEDCCRFLAGPGKTLGEFEDMMSGLAAMEESQYSYRNTIVALADDGSVAGICVGYPGADLHRLREAFFKAARTALGRDFSHIDDETGSGEYYLDSIAVYPQFRRQGIAKALLRSFIAKAHAAGLPAGLLVDKENPNAERLYTALGFEYVEDKEWSSHAMRHLRCYLPE